MNHLSVRLGAAAVAATLFCGSVWAADPVLVHGNKITITANDIQADALRMPPEMRSIVLAKAQTVAQIASNLYGRRALANKAEAEGMANDPLISAALQVARDKVLSDALLAKIDKDSTPSDADAEGLARSIYKAKPERFNEPERLQIRHILIAGTDGTSRAQAEKVLEELKGGADFVKLAQERSADQGSATKGGDLGLFARGSMVPEFDEAAFALKNPGDLSGVVETKFGFHILKLEARKPAGLKPFGEVREDLMKEVRSNLLQEARTGQAQKLQQNAKINEAAIEAFSDSIGKEGKAKK